MIIFFKDTVFRGRTVSGLRRHPDAMHLSELTGQACADRFVLPDPGTNHTAVTTISTPSRLQLPYTQHARQCSC